MIEQECTIESKQVIFDNIHANAFGKHFMDTFTDFCDAFDNGSKQITSDDKSELLAIYTTKILDPPEDNLIFLLITYPFDICFPNYLKPVNIIKFITQNVFEDNPLQDGILCTGPYIPFLGQSYILAGFDVLKESYKCAYIKTGDPVEGYVYYLRRPKV